MRYYIRYCTNVNIKIENVNRTQNLSDVALYI